MKRPPAFLTVLILAAAAALIPAAPAAAVSPAAIAPPFYVVRPGDTIKSIAHAYGIRRGDLRAWNGIRKPNQPSPDGVLHLAAPAGGRLSGWRSWVETVTPAAVNWDARDKCPVLPADLRKVRVTYIDFYGISHQGSIVVHRTIATTAGSSTGARSGRSTRTARPSTSTRCRTRWSAARTSTRPAAPSSCAGTGTGGA